VDISEAILLDNFLPCLYNSIKADVLAKKPSDVNEAIEIANWYNKTLNRIEKHAVNLAKVKI
jgi:hypothetical protein